VLNSSHKPHDLVLHKFVARIQCSGWLGCLALARWAGWSAGQVGRHVKSWRKEWNGVSGPRDP